jgi:MFS family permease
MFIFSPIVAAMCIYIAVLYGLLYILFTTFTFVFEDVYHFTTSTAGLAFLGSGIGTLLGLAFVATLSDKIVAARRTNDRPGKPEDRLPPLIVVPSALFIAFGLIIYGWGAEKAVHWIVPQLGTALTGFGMIAILMCIQTYLVDAFTLYAASVIAASAVLRSLLGALIPLGGLGLYDAIGLGWGNTLLGLIALMLAPIPWVLGVYGERIRTNPRFQVKF